MFELNGNPR